MRKGNASFAGFIIAAFSVGLIVLVSQAFSLGLLDTAPVRQESFTFGVPEESTWNDFTGQQGENNIAYVDGNTSIEMDDQTSGQSATWRSRPFTNSTGVDNRLNRLEVASISEPSSRAFVVIEESEDFSTFGVEEEYRFELEGGNNTFDALDIRGREFRFDVELNNTNNGRSYQVEEVVIYGTERTEETAIIDSFLQRTIELVLIILALVVLLAIGRGS